MMGISMWQTHNPGNSAEQKTKLLKQYGGGIVIVLLHGKIPNAGGNLKNCLTASFRSKVNWSWNLQTMPRTLHYFETVIVQGVPYTVTVSKSQYLSGMKVSSENSIAKTWIIFTEL